MLYFPVPNVAQALTGNLPQTGNATTTAVAQFISRRIRVVRGAFNLTNSGKTLGAALPLQFLPCKPLHNTKASD
jgi:hypothetical protein